jgi:hypothetical protein
MAVGSSISAADFNNIRSILLNNFGPGQYGFASGTGANDIPNSVTGGNDIATSDSVLSADVERLFSVGQLIHYHQNGAIKTISSGTTYPGLQTGQVIEWADWGDAGDVKGLYDLANSCASFDRRTTEFGGDFSTVVADLDEVDVLWQNISGGCVYTWSSEDLYYEYWTTGGELRVNIDIDAIGSVGQASYEKNLNWQTMASNMGTIRLYARPDSAGTGWEWVVESLSNSGTGSVTAVSELTDAIALTTKYTKIGAGSIYNDNSIEVQMAVINGSNRVTLNVVMTDGDTGTGDPADGPQSTPIDEPVSANVNISCTQYYPDSTITLNDGTTDTDFSLGGNGIRPGQNRNQPSVT